VFKRNEEQEWTRFRGALSKEREEGAAVQEPVADPAPVAHPVAAAPAAAPAAMPNVISPQPAPGPSFRPSTGDVNVSVPSRARFTHDADVETMVGEHTTIEGTLKAEGAIRVLGSVQGEIQAKGAVYIEENAVVTAKVSAAQVTVAGRVDGQIHSDGKVEIRPTGRVTGEINAGALIVQEGAFFDGNSRMATGSSK